MNAYADHSRPTHFIAAMFALRIVLIVVVSRLPDENPLKRILTALSYRLGATIMAGAIAVPVEPIPELNVLYDLGVPIALMWYWFTFFRDVLRSSSGLHHTPAAIEPEAYRRR